MSITNGEPEPAQRNPQHSNGGVFESVRHAICALGFPYAQILTDHATHATHEDCEVVKHVPEGAAKPVKDPNECTPLVPVKDFEKNCPPRLRKLLPPANFGAVANGSVYRSSYPMEENYAFLKSLKLKTIITLVPEECAPHYVKFMSESGINHVQVHIPANKGEVRIQISEMQKALKVVTDQSNWPILIHCNKGKHRTGCVVGCFRRLLGEGFNPIFEEYHTYADPKARIWDEAFMEKFDVEVIHQAEYQQKADPVSAPGDVVTLAVATQTPPPGWSARISKV